MIIAIFSMLILLAGLFIIKKKQWPIPFFNVTGNRYLIGGLIAIVGLFGLFSRSFVIINADEIGHLNRIYMASDLPSGRIVAQKGEKGPQAEILGPGFHFIWLVKVLYDVETFPVVEVPEGMYAFLIAKDGLPLRNEQFIADPWPADKIEKMLQGEYFLREGKGQKGPQLTILKPGKYRFNHYLFDYKLMKALDVKTGYVAVIRSNVETRSDCHEKSLVIGQKLNAPIVPKGCRGVWEEPLKPGRYNLNAKAYIPTIMPSRAQIWNYRGGYTKRTLNLQVNDDGTLTQNITKTPIKVPKDAADKSITVRSAGWEFPADVRLIYQVEPKNAPLVVASLGSLVQVENVIVTPFLRDGLRSIGGKPDSTPLDFIEKRESINAELLKLIAPESERVGVTITAVKLGEPALPPEFMLPRLRKQLASQLSEAYIVEKKAQKERTLMAKERAIADQQPELVKAKIRKEAAEFKKEELRLQGEGEKLKLMEIAIGQQKQVDVLGQDRVMQLQLVKEVLSVAKDNPDIIKVPMVQVSGSGTSLEGAAAVLGASNLTSMLKTTGK